MGLSFTDVTALVTKGYKISEINEVKQIVDTSPEEGKNIIELAKKIGYADFKQAIELFAPATSDGSADQTDENDKPDNNDSSEGKPEGKPEDNNDQAVGDDNVDYKSLYEKEKSLREQLQHSNTHRDVSDHDDKRTDEEIALSFASDCLN